MRTCIRKGVSHGNLQKSSINVGDCNDLIISGNTVKGEFSYGIILQRCQQATVSCNSIQGSEYWLGDIPPVAVMGIDLAGSQQTTVTANSVRGFQKGVVEDVFSYNYGEIIIQPDNNVILGNILVNNDKPVGENRGVHSVYANNIPPLLTPQ